MPPAPKAPPEPLHCGTSVAADASSPASPVALPQSPVPPGEPSSLPDGVGVCLAPLTSPFLPNPSYTACKWELCCQGTAPRVDFSSVRLPSKA